MLIWPFIPQPWVLAHRVGLHEELKRQATAVSGAGTQANLHKSSPVVDINVSSATITLESGATFSGDLVIGADGVSVSYTHISTHSPALIDFFSRSQGKLWLGMRSNLSTLEKAPSGS